MKVELRKLRPNPHRDFKIDPIDMEKVKELTESIEQDGFWSGVVARQKNGQIEIAAGHTRVAAAIEAGETHADIFVGNFDDQGMIRVYARENATQRGNSGLAIAGSVASSIKYLSKAILTDRVDPKIGSDFDIEKLRRNLGNENGLGAPIILKFLEHIPGINKSVVTHQIANLKASGDYARIVEEVDAEIAKEEQTEAPERQEETPARKTSKKAVTASKKRTPTFDFEGVARHLKNENQIRVFREVCEGDSMKKYLPVNKQSELAKELVRLAKATESELSGTFIKDNMISLMMDAAQVQGKLDKESREMLERQDVRTKWTNTMHHFARQVGGITKDGRALLKLAEAHPDLKLRISTELKVAVQYAQEIINKLANKLEIKTHENDNATNTRTSTGKLSLGNRS